VRAAALDAPMMFSFMIYDDRDKEEGGEEGLL